VHQIGYLQRLHRDARSTERKSQKKSQRKRVQKF